MCSTDDRESGEGGQKGGEVRVECEWRSPSDRKEEIGYKISRDEREKEAWREECEDQVGRCEG